MREDLAKGVKGSNFDGVLVIGDLHAEFGALQRAYKYAAENNFFLVSLGDLVDRGAYPFECVKFFYNLMMSDRAGFCVGNHDDKFRRFAHGAKVTLSKDHVNTLLAVGDERKEEFLKMYVEVCEMAVASGYFHVFDDFIFAHAASHPCMWEDTEEFGKTAYSRSIFGETNGEVYPDGLPVRLYNWVDEIPAGRTVIVGHDKSAIFNVPLTAPLERVNANGGKAIFIDTGCGKGGFLSGVTLRTTKDKFQFESFVDFKLLLENLNHSSRQAQKELSGLSTKMAKQDTMD